MPKMVIRMILEYLKFKIAAEIIGLTAVPIAFISFCIYYYFNHKK